MLEERIVIQNSIVNKKGDKLTIKKEFILGGH